MKRICCLMSAVLTVFAAGCDDHDHGPGGHTHAAPDPKGPAPEAHGAHGPSVVLGESKVAQFTVKAARDEGAITAGREAAIDAWIDGPAGEAKPLAVRFWVGSADGKGAMKAKAGPEKGSAANHYHSHVELSADLAADAKLHIEIEDAAGKIHLASFDLKR